MVLLAYGSRLCIESAVTCATLISTISTCRNYPNCRDRPRAIHCRRATGRGLYSPRTHSSCLQKRNTARRPRERPLLGGPSWPVAQRVRGRSVRIHRAWHHVAKRRADLHDAGSDTGTDRADRIHSTAAGALPQRYNACRERLVPPGTRPSHRESLPHETVKRVFCRPCSQTVV